MNTHKFLSTVLFTSALTFSVFSSHMAKANKIEMPLRPWSYSEVRFDTGVSGCKLSSEFDGGSEVIFIAWGGELQAVKITLGELVLKGEAQTPIKGIIGFAGNNYFEVDASIEGPRTVMIALKGATELLRGLYSSPIMTFELDGVTAGYSLGGANAQLKTFAGCQPVQHRADVLHEIIGTKPVYNTSRNYIVSDGKGGAEGTPSLTINPFPVARSNVRNGAVESTSRDFDEAFHEIVEVDAVKAEAVAVQEIEPEVKYEEPVVQLGRITESPYGATGGGEASLGGPVNVSDNNRRIYDVTSHNQGSSMVEDVYEEAQSDIQWRAARSTPAVVRPVQIGAAELLPVQDGSLPHSEELAQQHKGVRDNVIVDVDTRAPRMDVVVPEVKWRVSSGASLRQTLAEWSLEQGGELVWDVNGEFQVPHDADFSSSYEEAVAGVLHQFSARSGAARPVGELYADPDTGKKVLVIKTDDNSATRF